MCARARTLTHARPPLDTETVSIPLPQVKDLVYEELLRIAEAACPRDLPRFPALQRRLAQAVLDFIQAGGERGGGVSLLRPAGACARLGALPSRPGRALGARAGDPSFKTALFKTHTFARPRAARRAPTLRSA